MLSVNEEIRGSKLDSNGNDDEHSDTCAKQALAIARATRDQNQTFPKPWPSNARVLRVLDRLRLRSRTHHCATAQCGESQQAHIDAEHCRAGENRRDADLDHGHSGAVRARHA